ncbi:MAG: DsbA family oxidoreductase [Rhodocyclales bacterium]|nr:DsbA family oxidoreductase [Rhodocyclales bacterium]
MTLTIDVVSDVVCPWCFIGKRHLDKAIALWRAEHSDSEVTVSWHPFFLNPDTPEGGEPYRPFLEKKFGGPQGLAEIWQRVREAGKPAGIDFAFEKIELRANTLAAHRLIHYAQKIDATQAAALVEALFAAQFLEGRHVGDRAILAEIAGGCGYDAAAVKAYLDSDEDADAVKEDAEQSRRMGINGVPFFVFNQKLAASGAQAPEALLGVMRQAGA